MALTNLAGENKNRTQFEAVEVSAAIERQLAGASWRISKNYGAEREDVERSLRFALLHADRTFDPSFGMTREAYFQLCLRNGIRHVCRKLKPAAEKSRLTDHLDDVICGEWTLGDTLSDRRTGPEKLHRALAIREWLDRLTGLPWAVAIASLCGFKFSEIARKLGIARTSFDRRFAPFFATLEQGVGHA